MGKQKVGRPLLFTDGRKQVSLYLSLDEYSLLMARVVARGVTVSQYLRFLVERDQYWGQPESIREKIVEPKLEPGQSNGWEIKLAEVLRATREKQK